MLRNPSTIAEPDGDASKPVTALIDARDSTSNAAPRFSSKRGGLNLPQSSVNDPPTSASVNSSALKVENGFQPKVSSFGMARLSAFRRRQSLSPWSLPTSILVLTLFSAIMISAIVYSFFNKQPASKGCRMSWMNPSYAKEARFDSEWSRLAGKYTLYLYREAHLDGDNQIKGIPVLFIPGNAGSYKQVRPIAAEAAQYWYDYLQHDAGALSRGAAPLDIFTVDFNEDLTAFHGQTVLDQAEYLNAAISYILGIYTDPTRALRRDELVDPASVIIIAHSMGGIVARTMFTVPNYQPDSINTLITMSTPHARAPVSFDGEMIRIYDRVNKYWRDSFLRPTGAINPLAEVALISIAGGSLDRVVASDYASIASLVPATHGFTSYTSTVPEVWTESDHLSILWCDQFRKVIVKSIFDVVDGKRKSQTHPLAERLASLRKRFLTGMELRSQRRFGSSVPSTLLTIEQRTSTLLTDGASLSLRLLGDSSQAQKPQAYMIPLNHSHAGSLRIQLLTDQSLDSIGDSAGLEVFLCSMSLPGRGHTQVPFQRSMDLSGGSSTPTRLACTNVASEAIQLPASNSLSVHPFDEGRSMSHLQFNLSELSDFEYVVIVDKHLEPTSGWLLAEIADYNSSMLQPALSLPQLIRSSFHLKLPVSRSLVTTVQLPAMHSSLLAYVARLETGECAESEQSPLYQPLLRHYRSDPYESHYHVNAKELFLSMHGTAPFMPLPLEPHPALDGNSLEVWTDPTCANNLTLTINLDIVGSLGKLVMRYRTVFAAFPLFVVSIVLWKQFRVYDESGLFITFSEGLYACSGRIIPMAVGALALLSLATSFSSANFAITSNLDLATYDMILGLSDSFFWFLVPLFSAIAVGVCVLVNYAGLILTHSFSAGLQMISQVSGEHGRRDFQSSDTRVTSNFRRRLFTMLVLFALVAYFLPYQFAYVVACLVQLANAARALPSQGGPSELASRAGATPHPSTTMTNYSNYAHAILMLMIWILPINAPVLVVWIYNLTVHYFSPFSSHHNVLSIMPIILLVETMTGGRMIPRLRGRASYVTSGMLLFISGYAAIYGISFAYQLHHLVNLFATWLVAVYLYPGGLSFTGISEMLNDSESGEGKERKQKH